MTSSLQTILAVTIVAACLVGLVVRAMLKRRKPGCGGDCGCASSQIRARARELDV